MNLDELKQLLAGKYNEFSQKNKTNPAYLLLSHGAMSAIWAAKGTDNYDTVVIESNSEDVETIKEQLNAININIDIEIFKDSYDNKAAFSDKEKTKETMIIFTI